MNARVPGCYCSCDTTCVRCIECVPTYRRLVKIEQQWDNRVKALGVEAANKTREIECKHKRERKALVQVHRQSTLTSRRFVNLAGKHCALPVARSKNSVDFPTLNYTERRCCETEISQMD